MSKSEPLFTYAVIADTHMNQAEDFSSSPYPCNALANARTRRVIAELNRVAPDFVIHLGDIVNPVPELPTYGEAAGHFKDLVKNLDMPIHLVPGNHDVGDKPVSWMPAGTVNDEHLALYKTHFGDHYYAFDHNDLHVVVVNTPIINSGLSVEAVQKEWLEADFRENANKRTVLCLHYPPYVSNPGENGSYDNLDEPGRTWLLDLIDHYQPEMVFCGHVHNFWYDRRGDTEIFLLPSTAFVRHDYSEFFRIGPGDQFGRNDEPKLGYFIVRVYADGQVVENIRTYGRTLDDGDVLAPEIARVRNVQSRQSAITSLGLDMRHPWAEEMEVAPSGAVDEFERKIARNDYPVLALWEMGVRKMRVPVQDIFTPKTRDRMGKLAAIGHLFQVYAYGLPSPEQRAVLSENAGLIDTLEIIAPWETAESMVGALAQIKSDTVAEVLLSRVNRKDAQKFEGARFNHLISHGFVLAEKDDLAAFVAEHDAAGTIDGFMFRVTRDILSADAAAQAEAFVSGHGRKACLYIRTAGSSPADGFHDDAENGRRIAESVLAAVSGGAGVSVILDTFADVDRGYFTRNGLVDRRYNPRSTSHMVKSMIGLLQAGPWRRHPAVIEGGKDTRVLTISNDGGDYLHLVLNTADVNLRDVLASLSVSPDQGLIVDLETGTATGLNDAGADAPSGPAIVLEASAATRAAIIKSSSHGG